MWDNIVLWRLAVAGLILIGILISIFYLLKLKKIKKQYDKSIDEAEKDVRTLKGKENEIEVKYGKIINTLVDLLHAYEVWAVRKDTPNKIAFNTIRKELPPEVQKLIKIKV